LAKSILKQSSVRGNSRLLSIQEDVGDWAKAVGKNLTIGDKASKPFGPDNGWSLQPNPSKSHYY